MDREMVQDPVHRVRVTVVAVQALGSRVIKVIKVIKAVKAIRAVTINNLVRGVSSSSLDIRLTRNS